MVTIENSNTSYNWHCPYKLINEYIEVRPPLRHNTENYELFLVFSDRSPVKLYHFRRVLQNTLNAIGLNQANYNIHSLRVGHLIDLFKMGCQLRKLR